MKVSLSKILARMIVDRYGEVNSDNLSEKQLQALKRAEHELDKENEKMCDDGNEYGGYTNDTFGTINCLFDEAQDILENPEKNEGKMLQ